MLVCVARWWVSMIAGRQSLCLTRGSIVQIKTLPCRSRHSFLQSCGLNMFEHRKVHCGKEMISTTFTQPVLLIEVITLINQESVPKEFACSMREKPECFF